MSTEPIKVLVVDDHQLMIEGLRSLLEDEEDIQFVSGANSLAEAIDCISRHKVDVIIMDNLSSPPDTLEPREEKKAILSAREAEVLNLIAREYSNEQIAEKLFISERTVEAHRRNIFIKTKTKSIVGLMKYAIEKGLIDTSQK